MQHPLSPTWLGVENGAKNCWCWALTEKNAMKDSRGPWREWETDGYGVVQWSSERCDGTRRQGRMSPGRQRWGFRAWDGSALKNTGMPPLPACAPLPLKLQFSPSSVVYTLHLMSLFPHPLLSVPSSLNFIIISPPLCLLFSYLMCIPFWYIQKSHLFFPFSTFSVSETRNYKDPLTSCRILAFRRNEVQRLTLFASLSFVVTLECLEHKWLPHISFQPFLRSRLFCSLTYCESAAGPRGFTRLVRLRKWAGMRLSEVAAGVV